MSKNILFVMMRGIEGSGNTRFTLELEEECRKYGHNTLIIANSEKRWPREKTQKNDIVKFNVTKVDNIENVYKDIFKPDIIVVMSVQAVSKDFSNDGKEKFNQFLREQKNNGIKTVYFQVDHKLPSINRNFYSDERYTEDFFNNLDLVITHAEGEDFTQKFINRRLPNYLFDICYHACVGIPINGLASYRKDVKDKYDHTICYLGRSAFWKGWVPFKDLHYNYLMSHGYTSIAMGIERNISIVSKLYKDYVIGKKVVDCTPVDDLTMHPDREDVLEFLNNNHEILPLQIWGNYVRENGLEVMSRCKFGYFGTYLGDTFTNAIENTLTEIVSVGTLPIVRKCAYDIWNIEGTLFKDINPDDIGFIVYDEDKPEELIKKLDELNSDNNLYDVYRERLYKFALEKLDRTVLFSGIIEDLVR